MVDIVIDDLPMLTLAINTTTKLPTRIFQMVHNNLFGDTMQTLEFTDCKAVNGLQLPTLLTNWQDKREIGQIRINRTTIDGAVGNLAAPALAAAQQQPGGTWRVNAARESGPRGRQGGVAGHRHDASQPDRRVQRSSDDGRGNNPERVNAVWARAKKLRPNKPITKLIVTHHHFDHTGGVREAVGLGVTEIIAHQHTVN